MRVNLIIVGAFLLVLGLATWAAPAFSVGELAKQLSELPRSALPLIGIPIGAGLALLLLSPLGTNWEAAPAPIARVLGRPALMLGATAAGAAILLVIGVAGGRIEPVPAALVLLLGMGALLALSFTLRDMADGKGIGFESHWGGLSGGVGGWRLSPASTTFLLTVILVGAVVAAAVGTDPADGPTNNAAAATPVKPPPTTETKGGGASPTSGAVRNAALPAPAPAGAAAAGNVAGPASAPAGTAAGNSASAAGAR